jgi:hypothetical protein
MFPLVTSSIPAIILRWFFPAPVGPMEMNCLPDSDAHGIDGLLVPA